MDCNMTILTDFEKSESLTPTIYSNNQKSGTSTKSKTIATQTFCITTDFMFKTQDDLKFCESRLTTPFPELLNSSGILKKFDINPSSTMTVKPFDLSQNNSGLVTVDRRTNSKDRPASVIQKKNNFDFTRKSSSNDSINRHEGRYTPIGKLEILCEDTKRCKEDWHPCKTKLKDISNNNFKAKSSSISSNNRRGKKSAARIERSKQILSKSCERKSSKSKKNMDYK